MPRIHTLEDFADDLGVDFNTILRSSPSNWEYFHEDRAEPIFKEVKKEEIEYPEEEFGMKFGVEMEFEAHKEYNYFEIFSILQGEGINNVEVDSDGSLSPYGFEIISPPLDSLNDIQDFMVRVTQILKDNGYEIYTESPCAIHIHVSNIKNPINLFSLAKYYANIFEYIRTQHHNGLVHRIGGWPHSDHINNVKKFTKETVMKNYPTSEIKRLVAKKIDPLFAYKCGAICDSFMGSRRCTLRFSGWDTSNRTLEFRVFPHILNDDMYQIYTDIVRQFIIEAESVEDGDLYAKFHLSTTSLYEKFESFINLVNLDEKGVGLLFNGGKIIKDEALIGSEIPTRLRNIINSVDTYYSVGEYKYAPYGSDSYIILKLLNGIQLFKVGGRVDYGEIHSLYSQIPGTRDKYSMEEDHIKFYIPWVIVDSVSRMGDDFLIYLKGMEETPILLSEDGYDHLRGKLWGPWLLIPDQTVRVDSTHIPPIVRDFSD